VPGLAVAYVSCVSAAFCIGVNGGGYALAWNGTSWSTDTPELLGPNKGGSNLGGNARVSCPTASFCVAIFPNGSATIGRTVG
jgi:hypothetical protein